MDLSIKRREYLDKDTHICCCLALNPITIQITNMATADTEKQKELQPWQLNGSVQLLCCVNIQSLGCGHKVVHN